MGNRPCACGGGDTARPVYNAVGLQYLPEKRKRNFLTRRFSRQNSKRTNETPRNGHIPTEDDVAQDDVLEGRTEERKHRLRGLFSAREEHTKSLTDLVEELNRQYDMDHTTQGSYSSGVLDMDALRNFDFPFENVVLSGGGSKGYSYVGAIKALEDVGVASRVKRVAGSSAGAMCGALFCVGLTAQEIVDVFHCNIKWLFQDEQCQLFCSLPNVWRKFGVNPADRFFRIYGEHIANKVGNPDLTFAELYRKYGRELCVVVTNLNRMCSEYCHWKTTPDLPIRTAVRMSMAFPVVFQAVKYNLHGRESLYMDGGTLDQYPVHAFDGPEFELNHNEVTGRNKHLANEKTLGLYVVSESAIDYKIWRSLFDRDIPNKPAYLPDTKLARARLKREIKRRKRKNKAFSKKEFMKELKELYEGDGDVTGSNLRHYETTDKTEVDISNFSDFFVTTIETLLISQRKMHVKPKDVDRTVAINCGYIGTNDYHIEPGDREFLIKQGYVCTMKYLEDYSKRVQQSDSDSQATESKQSPPSEPPQLHIPWQKNTSTSKPLVKQTSVVSSTSRETEV